VLQRCNSDFSTAVLCGNGQ